MKREGSRTANEPMTTLGGKSDSELVVAIKKGENEAFEFLMSRYDPRILAVAFRITRNREDAQDVAQETFHKAFKHLDAFQGKSSFSTWLTRIAINEALMHVRKCRSLRNISLEDMNPEGESLPAEIPDRGKSPAEIYEQLENEAILCKALNELSMEFRTVVCLQLEERTVREAAEILGLGIGTLKARLFRARQKLRVLLTRRSEFRGNRTIGKARQRRDGGLNSIPRRSERRVGAPVRLEVKPAVQVPRAAVGAAEGYSGAGITKALGHGC